MPFGRRRAGVLLHPSSLPDAAIGHSAYRFVDFLAAAGASIWQMLPIGPTHASGSPYDGLSTRAGNPDLISRDWLVDRGWLAADQRDAVDFLNLAWQGFAGASPADRTAFARFKQERAGWLDSFARYLVLRHVHGGASWRQWPAAERDRDPAAIAALDLDHAVELERVQFEQFVFFSQWLELKAYANRRGVLLFGDLPLFVAHDSADTWLYSEQFLLDEQGRPSVVAGVPPDYFSAQGQRWGNPLYRWPAMERDDFAWWRGRLATLAELFDLVRIDHFRGLQAFWEIPARSKTAQQGRWVEAPGDALLRTLRAAFPSLALVAENLGTITAEVEALRQRHEIPGMTVLQFAFDGGADNPHLPHNHATASLVYTGTHDNDTTRSWYQGLATDARRRIREYLGNPTEAMPWPLIRAAFASVARLAVVPMQDLLALGSEARMNIPGKATGNWQWRYSSAAIDPALTERLRKLVELYGRAAG